MSIKPQVLATSIINSSTESTRIGTSDSFLSLQQYVTQLEQLLAQLPPEQQSAAIILLQQEIQRVLAQYPPEERSRMIELLRDMLSPQLAQRLLPSSQ